MRTFEYKDEKSSKFWNIELQGTSFTVTYGRIGTNGQTQTKEFDTEEKARKAHDKLVDEKLGKGYVETTVVAKAAPSTVLTGLEKALVKEPDDIASHSAYADYLMEQNDPRGELIQTQLRLEEPDLKDKEREELQKKADALIHQYARHWLGDVGRFLVGKWSGPDKPYHFEIVRGWLDMVRALPWPPQLFHGLTTAPEARLLRRLEIVYDMDYHPYEFDEFTEPVGKALREDEEAPDPDDAFYQAEILPPLLAGDGLKNLRSFKLGYSDRDPDHLRHSTMVGPFIDCTAQQLLDLLKKCPHLEELYLNDSLSGMETLFGSPLLKNLRVFQHYFGGPEYSQETLIEPRLSVLTENRNLKKLHTLRLHPGRDSSISLPDLTAIVQSKNLPSLTHLQVHMSTFGDEGCRAIVDSGILKRLKTLDIGYGNITDEGARLLAECPELKNLESLNVSCNALTADGINALTRTGVKVIADAQHPVDDMDFLYEVDVE